MKINQSINCVLGLCLLSLSALVKAETLHIAAAADLKFALDEAVLAFKQSANPTFKPASDRIEVIYGSSGKFHTQILQGAPYDLYFSADISYPESLIKQGLVAGTLQPYATGRIVVWRLKANHPSPVNMDSLRADNIQHIAIANPAHAPYGRRAQEALTSDGSWETVKSKLVYGDNISQTTQFVQTGNAQIGIIALSLAMSPELSRVGEYYLIPEKLHAPLLQGFVLTKRAQHNSLANAFAQYMTTDSAKQILMKYGFNLPT